MGGDDVDLEFSHAELTMPVGIPRKQLKMYLKFRKRSDLEKAIWEPLAQKSWLRSQVWIRSSRESEQNKNGREAILKPHFSPHFFFPSILNFL